MFHVKHLCTYLTQNRFKKIKSKLFHVKQLGFLLRILKIQNEVKLYCLLIFDYVYY